MALVGIANGNGLAVELHGAGLEWHDPEQGLGQLRAAGTLQARNAQHLALAQLEIDVLEECVASILHSQDHLAELLGRAERREVVIQRPAHHQEDDIRRLRLRSC